MASFFSCCENGQTSEFDGKMKIDYFLKQTKSPKVNIRNQDDWDFIHDHVYRVDNKYMDILTELYPTIAVESIFNCMDVDFTPLILKFDYLADKMDMLRKDIEVLEKEKFILLNSNHPTFKFDNIDRILDLLNDLIDTKYQFLQVTEGVIQMHVKNYHDKKLLPSGEKVKNLKGNK